MITATKVKDLEGWRGTASLYQLSAPVTDYDGRETEYVIVSAAMVPTVGPETFIFPADENGEPTTWQEMQGSYRGALDHERALRNAGWELIEGDLQ